ncbi:hypothetical protein HELRODRAFT_184986 [Helobdella robusta]|uniref:Bax inhibitor 1 n=1 Tax=Helobdella robusta TaxID=6412 RepID=T1FM83_HELRO|nr:hypothetical protein HELRODRAFT_184986 [Helobdella robusta]ESO02384.1 hypothetical protein HELRODRAFT_184986 [Helobdella robusta]
MSSSIKNFMESFRFGHLEKPVKDHLKNVYGAMGICLFVCAFGAYVHMFTDLWGAGFITSLATLGLLLGLISMPPTESNMTTRFAMLNGIAFLSGVSLGPLLEMVVKLNPQIITTAFMGTSLVFICFSISALICNDRRYLALAGTLMSGLTVIVLLGLLNIFIGSELIFRIEIYLGLAIMCGFVLFDTQMIVEKCRQGDFDYVHHCLDLFLDFVNIFRYLLIILSNKEANNNRRRRRSDD